MKRAPATQLASLYVVYCTCTVLYELKQLKPFLGLEEERGKMGEGEVWS